MKDIIGRLKSKQSQIQEKQRIEERRRGQVDQIQKTVQTEFGVSDLEKAVDKLTEIDTAISNDAETLESLEAEMDAILAKANGEEVAADVGTVQK